MERNTIIVIAMCIVFYLLYNEYLDKKYPDRFAVDNKKVEESVDDSLSTTPETTDAVQNKGEASISEIPSSDLVEALSEKDLIIENSDIYYVFDQYKASLQKLTLKNYSENSKEFVPVDLIGKNSYPLTIEANANFDAKDYGMYHAKREGNKLSFWKQKGDWLISLVYNIPESGYSSSLDISYKNTSNQTLELDTNVIVKDTVVLSNASSLFSFTPRNYFAVVGLDNSSKREDLSSACSKPEVLSLLEGTVSTMDFIGEDLHYFTKLFKPKIGKVSYLIKKEENSSKASCNLNIGISQKQGRIEPGNQVVLSFTNYFGPKDVKTLSVVDKSFVNTIYLGWFDIIARPLLDVIKNFYKFTHNYGLAIIILTILLKLLFYPLSRSAAVSAKKMQTLQPAMNAIRQQYKDEPQRQQQELMKFMSQNKINPAAGCLPVLPQIPVFIAFYNVLSQSIELRHSPFIGWIHDLSAPDPYFIMPLLLGAGMFLQQKLMPSASMDKNQQRIMMAMPIIFTVMMLSLPSGLVLYMLTNTAFSILQQRRFNRTLGMIPSMIMEKQKQNSEGK